MGTLRFEYALTLSDYRMALFFGNSIRHRTLLRIFVVTAVVAAVYSAGGYLGIWPFSMLPAYIFFGYAVWLLFLIAQIQHGMLKYIKSPQNLIGKTVIISIDRSAIRLETPHTGETASYPLQNLFYVFEISRMFLIYLNAEQSVLLPFRAMSASERTELRDRFRGAVNDRFQTRYGLGAAPKMQPLDGRKRRFF